MIGAMAAPEDDFAASALKTCQRLLGAAPSAWEAPGGQQRRSLRVHTHDGPVIVTRRRRANRAALEIAVLQALHEHGAPVPRVLAAGGGWLIQEDLGTRRLSAVLAGADAPDWLERAVASLAAVHEAGRRAGLARQVAPLGADPRWLGENVLAAPAKLGRLAGIAPAALDREKLGSALFPAVPCFIKWDARPGNAVARRDGRVAWFDWEHCGVRCALDDLAWLLGDEYAAIAPTEETAILDRHLSRFADGRSLDEARRYLHIFGTFHVCVRLGLILAHKGEGPWWDPALCLERDKIAVTKDAALGLCERGARWSAQAWETAPLAPWFREIAGKLAGP